MKEVFFPEGEAREGCIFLFVVLSNLLPGFPEALLNTPVILIGLLSPLDAMVVAAPPRRGGFSPTLYWD
jgi:hypothetical protein